MHHPNEPRRGFRCQKLLRLFEIVVFVEIVIGLVEIVVEIVEIVAKIIVRNVRFGELYRALGIVKRLGRAEDNRAVVVLRSRIEERFEVVVRIAIEQPMSSEHLKISLATFGQVFAFIDEWVDGQDHIVRHGYRLSFFAFPKSGRVPDEFHAIGKIGPV